MGKTDARENGCPALLATRKTGLLGAETGATETGRNLKQEGLSGTGLSLSELRKCYLLMVGLQY